MILKERAINWPMGSVPLTQLDLQLLPSVLFMWPTVDTFLYYFVSNG